MARCPSSPSIAPLRPRVRRGALLGRAHDRARAAPLGARGHPAGQGPLRRLDRHPLLLPRGDLRLLRRAHQRPARPGLPHAPRRGADAREGRRHRGRADGQHARHQGPHRRHGRGPLEEDPARHAVAHRQGADARARVHRPARAMVDVTQSMACIQCGACVSDCLSMEVDPCFIGPAALAKAYRFVGDPRDAEQRAPARTSPRTRTASTTARTASSASRRAPRASRR